MEKKELNFLDRFLYKLLISTFLLLFVVFLGKIGVINFKAFQADLGSHFNILKVLKSLNGKNNFLLPIDINDQVSGEAYEVFHNNETIPNGLRINVNEFQGVEIYKTGIIVEIKRNNDNTYRLKVKGLDEYIYVYDKVKTVNCNIYKIVKSGEVIGSPSPDNAGGYFEFYVYNKDEPVNIFIE